MARDTLEAKGEPPCESCKALKITLSDVREWIISGMVNDVHYDEASIISQIDDALNA